MTTSRLNERELFVFTYKKMGEIIAPVKATALTENSFDSAVHQFQYDDDKSVYLLPPALLNATPGNFRDPRVYDIYSFPTMWKKIEDNSDPQQKQIFLCPVKKSPFTEEWILLKYDGKNWEVLNPGSQTTESGNTDQQLIKEALCLSKHTQIPTTYYNLQSDDDSNSSGLFVAYLAKLVTFNYFKPGVDLPRESKEYLAAQENLSYAKKRLDDSKNSSTYLGPLFGLGGAGIVAAMTGIAILSAVGTLGGTLIIIAMAIIGVGAGYLIERTINRRERNEARQAYDSCNYTITQLKPQKPDLANSQAQVLDQLGYKPSQSSQSKGSAAVPPPPQQHLTTANGLEAFKQQTSGAGVVSSPASAPTASAPMLRQNI